MPPAATGWLSSWTARGLRARYCDDTLLVYLAPETVKGVGGDHRAVQVAPYMYGSGSIGAERATLHWLEGGAAKGGVGRASVSLPSCLSAAAFGGALPSGRAALAGAVQDPYLSTRTVVSSESTVQPCAAGSHGAGVTLSRAVEQDRNGRDDAVGSPSEGSWQMLVDQCRTDYTEWEDYVVDCTWYEGAPHNETMSGEEIWRRQKTVSSSGASYGAPQFVSTSCWTASTPTPPVPVIAISSVGETRHVSCTTDYIGSKEEQRTKTTRSTQFPWDDASIDQISYSSWVLTADNCCHICNKSCGGNSCGFAPGPGDGPGSGDGGY